MSNEKRKCIFAGTFDPPTLGHKHIVQECVKLFDEVVVAVLVNPSKTPYFTLEARLKMLEAEFGEAPCVRVRTFTGTVAALLREEKTDIYVRGIRNGVDLDYENANFYASKKLYEGLTAVYLPCPQHLLHVSSSMVRSSLQFGTPIDEYVSERIRKMIEKNERENRKE